MKKLRGVFMLAFLPFVLMGCVSDEVVESETPVEPNQNKLSELTSTREHNREHLTLGDFTVLEGLHGFPGDQTDALTIEEAAAIGGRYVLDVLDDDLEGMYMEMTFNYNPHISHSTWIGNIAASPADFGREAEGFMPGLIVFTLDAVTGERISIFDSNVESVTTVGPLELLSEEERWALFPEPDEDEMALALAIAHDYAERHFSDSEVNTIVPGVYFGGTTDSAYFPSSRLHFVATGDGGKIIEIMIQRETMELFYLGVPLEILVSDF